jgi:hypothetical protein
MSAPVGNKYAIGNKGGGRKSAFQEQADAAFFADLWNGRLKKERLQRKIQKGRYGAKHILAVKILEGNEKLLAKLLDKFFPDQISCAGFFEPEPTPVSKEEEAQIINAFRNFGLLKEDDTNIASEKLN